MGFKEETDADGDAGLEPTCRATAPVA
jgi:hypothetical protein